jgi:hypothetical protein
VMVTLRVIAIMTNINEGEEVEEEEEDDDDDDGVTCM